MKQKIRFHIIIGLGNPGVAYRDTYHNVGLSAVDYYAEKGSHRAFKIHASKTFSYSQFENLVLVRSLVHMNISGRAVREVIRFFGATPAETLVAHDDSDIILGKFKISFDRGPAGHHGVESVVRHLKTKGFWRLRIGIRKEIPKQTARAKASEFVLKRINLVDKKILQSVFEKSLRTIEPVV